MTDGVSDLVDVWNSRSTATFERWVRDVGQAVARSRMTLEAVGRLLNVGVAEIQAVINLSLLEDDELSLIAEAEPPKTTWFLLADAPKAAIEAGLKAISECAPGEPVVEKVRAAISEITGLDPSEACGLLSGATILHMANKAEQYGLHTDKSRNFMKSVGRTRRAGGTMSMRQAAYLRNLLDQMVDEGAIRRDSSDNDQAMCDEVLDALGR